MPTCGCVAPDLLRGDQSFVGVGGRHADVDDGDVGGVGGDVLEELVGVAGLGDDVDPAVGEEAGEALADDDGVVGEDHPHGIAAVTRVPWPGALSTRRWPSRASTRSRSPRSPAPSGSAPPTPSSVTSIATRPLARLMSIVARVAWACLTTLASASLATK